MSNSSSNIQQLVQDCEQLGLTKEAALLREAYATKAPHLIEELEVIKEVALVIEAMRNYEPFDTPEQVYYVPSLRYNTNGKAQRVVVGELGYALSLILKNGHGRHDVVTLERKAREQHEIFGAELRYLISLVGAYYNSTFEEENDDLITSELEISRGTIVSSVTKILHVLSALETDLDKYVAKPVDLMRDLTAEETGAGGANYADDWRNHLLEKTKEQLFKLTTALGRIKQFTERGRARISRENLPKLIREIEIVNSFVSQANSLETEMDLSSTTGISDSDLFWVACYRAIVFANKKRTVDRKSIQEQTSKTVSSFSTVLSREQSAHWSTLRNLASEASEVEDLVRDRIKRLVDTKKTLKARFIDLQRLEHKTKMLNVNFEQTLNAILTLSAGLKEIKAALPAMINLEKASASEILVRVESEAPGVLESFLALSPIYDSLFAESLKASHIAAFYNTSENNRLRLRELSNLPEMIKKTKGCRGLFTQVIRNTRPVKQELFVSLDKEMKKLEGVLATFKSNGLAIAPHEQDLYERVRNIVTKRQGKELSEEGVELEAQDVETRLSFEIAQKIQPIIQTPFGSQAGSKPGSRVGLGGGFDLIDSLRAFSTSLEQAADNGMLKSALSLETLERELENLKSRVYDLFDSGATTASNQKNLLKATADPTKTYQYPKEDGSLATIRITLDVSSQLVAIEDSEKIYSATSLAFRDAFAKMSRINQQLAKLKQPLVDFNQDEFEEWLHNFYKALPVPEFFRTPRSVEPAVSTQTEEKKTKKDQITNPDTVSTKIGLLRTFDNAAIGRATNITDLLRSLSSELELYRAFGEKERSWYADSWGITTETALEAVQQLTQYIGSSEKETAKDGTNKYQKGLLPLADRFVLSLYGEIDDSRTIWVSFKGRLSQYFKEIERGYRGFLSIEAKIRNQANPQADIQIPTSEMIALVATVGIDRVAQEIDEFVEKYKE